MKGVLFASGLLLAGATSPPSSVAGMHCFREGTAVRLTGTVTHRRFYGPPNYGETPRMDRLISVPILRLVRPITPCELTQFDREDRTSGEPVREVQIGGLTKLKSGQRRTLVGTIHAAAIGPEFLDYVLDVP